MKKIRYRRAHGNCLQSVELTLFRVLQIPPTFTSDQLRPESARNNNVRT